MTAVLPLIPCPRMTFRSLLGPRVVNCNATQVDQVEIGRVVSRMRRARSAITRIGPLHLGQMSGSAS